MERETQDHKSHMVQSPTVIKQMKDLEQQNDSDKGNKKGSTNEIQPMVTDEGLSQ
jgi:hypothetical protein